MQFTIKMPAKPGDAWTPEAAGSMVGQKAPLKLGTFATGDEVTIIGARYIEPGLIEVTIEVEQ